MGASDCLAYGNKITVRGENERYAIFMYRGADRPQVPGSDGRPRRNRLFSNYLLSDGDAVKLQNADENKFVVSGPGRVCTCAFVSCSTVSVGALVYCFVTLYYCRTKSLPILIRTNKVLCFVRWVCLLGAFSRPYWR